LPQLQQAIWEKVDSQNKDELNFKNVFEDIKTHTNSNDYNRLRDSVGEKFLTFHVEMMIMDAFNIRKLPKDQDHFKLSNNKVQIKSKNSGKYVDSIVEGYRNTFYYIKETKKTNEFKIEEKSENANFGHFIVPCGEISYSILLDTKNKNIQELNIEKYAHIFGFTGSLYLNQGEENLLKEKFSID